MSSLLEFNTELEPEYKDFLKDIKLSSCCYTFEILQTEVLEKKSQIKFLSNNFFELVSFLIIGLAVYHLVVKKLLIFFKSEGDTPSYNPKK